jgi:serine protease inhibitor
MARAPFVLFLPVKRCTRTAREFTMKFRRIPLFLVPTILLAGCDWITGSNADPRPPELITELPRALTVAERSLLGGSTQFGFALLREVLAADPAETHVLSPFSVSVALGMALNAADGETFDEMVDALGLHAPDGTPLDRDAINRSYRDLVDLLESVDPKVSFQVANSVWHDQPWTVRSSFAEAVDAYFRAPVTALDFRDPGAPDRIDDWVKAATRDRIDGIAPRPIPGDAVAYLVNALHFLGDWRTAFDPKDTRDHAFQGADGATSTVRMMHREGKFRTGSWNGHRSLDLPYGGAAWSMTVVLPRHGATVAELLAEMDDTGWTALTSDLTEVDGLVGLPRFTLEWKGSLAESLQALGMTALFSAFRADLSRLFEEEAELYVSDVQHKTYMRVDEKGTEAAAVTSVEIRVTSMPPSFIVDRPFLLTIRERHSGTVLFAGAIQEAPTDG